MAESKIEIFNLKEDPDRWEKLIEEETARGATEEGARRMVEAMYWEGDREHAFQRYLESYDFRTILDLLHVFQISRKMPLCEIGGGSGQLAWALAQSGFQDVTLLEPNSRKITGTGYLETVLDRSKGKLQICNDLSAWYASQEVYRTIVTRNCVHHFPNLAMTAASIRQKLKKGGRWVMIREWFAETSTELYSNLRNHPYCQKYQVYEFPFPPSYYVDCVEFAGFKLVGVVPGGYANDTLSNYVTDEGSAGQKRRWARQRSILKRFPKWGIFMFRLQSFLNRHFGTKFRTYARPQIMTFERVEVAGA